MGKGRRYEHDLAAAIDEATSEAVWVTTAGYSGNSRIDACDLVVTVAPEYAPTLTQHQFNVEVKKLNGAADNRTTVFSGSSKEWTGVDELHALRRATPAWGTGVVVVRWDHRAPAVLTVDHLSAALDTDTDVDIHGARATKRGNVSMVKPTTDDHPSAQAVDEGAYVATALALPLADHVDAVAQN